MAHSLLKAVSVDKLEGFLVCSICLETLKDPRTLPCCHSYCESCLARFVKIHRDKRVGRQINEFKCPTCQSRFTLNPGEEVADMPSNHFVCNMLDVMAVQDRVQGLPCSLCQESSVARCVTCEVFLCQKCLTDHSNYRGLKDHSVLTMDALSKPENQGKIKGKLYCKVKEHNGKALKFFCETCEELICRYCMDFFHAKQNHQCRLTHNVAESQRELLVSSCTTLEDQLKESNQLLETITNMTKSLDRVAENHKSEIIKRKQEILQIYSGILDNKAQCLLDKVDKIHARKRRGLVKQEEGVRLYINKMKGPVQHANTLLVNGNDDEIISSQKMIKNNLEKNQKEHPGILEPVDDDKIIYELVKRVDEKKLSEMFTDSLGRIKDGRKIQASKNSENAGSFGE